MRDALAVLFCLACAMAALRFATTAAAVAGIVGDEITRGVSRPAHVVAERRAYLKAHGWCVCAVAWAVLAGYLLARAV